jgi:hypothetical protein
MEVIEVTGERLPPTAILPPIAVSAIASPVGDAPKAPKILIGTVFPLDTVTDTVASTPSEIALELSPQAMHVKMPPPPEHDSVFPAGASAGPAVTFTSAMFAMG